MTTIQIDLPEATAQAAQAAGLLTPQALDHLLSDALRTRALERLDEAMKKLAETPLQPMSEEEIRLEIEAYRAAKRAATGS